MAVIGLKQGALTSTCVLFFHGEIIEGKVSHHSSSHYGRVDLAPESSLLCDGWSPGDGQVIMHEFN
jgi:hypothetical protein